MKKEQENLCLVAYDLDDEDQDEDLTAILNIRRRAGLHSVWPKPKPKVVPRPRVYNWAKERLSTHEFEKAIGLGWHVRAKHKFMRWLRKALKADYDMHDVIQGYGRYEGEHLNYHQTTTEFKGTKL